MTYVADRARGLKWSTVAARHGLTERRCQEIVKEQRGARPGLVERDPVAEVEEALDQYEDLIEQFALLAETSSHDGVKLGALKAQLRALAERLNLMRAVGVLPADLGLIDTEVNFRRTTEVFLGVLNRHVRDVVAAEDDLLEGLRDLCPVSVRELSKNRANLEFASEGVGEARPPSRSGHRVREPRAASVHGGRVSPLAEEGCHLGRRPQEPARRLPAGSSSCTVRSVPELMTRPVLVLTVTVEPGAISGTRWPRSLFRVSWAMPLLDTFIDPTVAPLTWTSTDAPRSETRRSTSTWNSRWPGWPGTARCRSPWHRRRLPRVESAGPRSLL